MRTIRKDDIILSIEGNTIADDKSVTLSSGITVGYQYLVSNKMINNNINIEILREGKKIQLNTPLNYRHEQSSMISNREYEKSPDYLIKYGFVLQPLNENLFSSEAQEIALLAIPYLAAKKDKSTDQIVFISQVLPHDLNFGYHNSYHQIISTINNNKINNMQEAIDAFESNQEQYDYIELETGGKIIINKKNANQLEQEILAAYQITDDRSSNYKKDIVHNEL